VSSRGSGGRTRTSVTRSKGGRPTTDRPPNRVFRVPRESVLRVSNPPVRRGKPVPCRSAKDASPSGTLLAEGEGVEPPRLIARPCSRRLPSPIGWPFRSHLCPAPGPCIAASGLEPELRPYEGQPGARPAAVVLLESFRSAPGAGIEPAGSSLTGRHMNQLMLPR
jgi:hypothetical protein